MPIYVYYCPKCDKKHELVFVRRPYITKYFCPDCMKEMEKQTWPSCPFAYCGHLQQEK